MHATEYIATYYSYMYIPYRMQGIRASLFCTNGELQNSYEHCGGHAEKVVNMYYTDSKQFCISLLHWLSGTHSFWISSNTVSCEHSQFGTHTSA